MSALSAPHCYDEPSRGSLPNILRSEGSAIERFFSERGAVLFRGFDASSPTTFDDAVASFSGDIFTHDQSLSNAVRVNVTARVFTANEAPPSTAIYLHHELAQTQHYPSKLFFYCETAPERGGETPFCRSDLLLSRMQVEAPDFVADIAAHGLLYSHTMPEDDDTGSGQGRGWRSTLNVTDRSTAENRLDELNYSWEWQTNGDLSVTTPRLDGIRQLPDGRQVFFNQLIAAYRGWSDKRNDSSRAVCLGNGTPPDADAMTKVINIADELTYDHKWQAGDVVLVDNFLMMHGRRPYEGRRRVLASLIA